jgi:Nif-specific regulatory protein
VDVRLICATHHDLAEMVRERLFRDDLYYRLSVMTLELPALRDYKNNLDVLAEVFMLQAARKLEKEIKRTSVEAMAMLHEYDFPGNVRELKNVMEHAVIMCNEEELLPEHLPRSVRSAVSPTPQLKLAFKTLHQMREQWIAPREKEYLLDLLKECKGDVKAVSRRAGVNPVTIYRLLKKRGISLRRNFRYVKNKVP